MKHLKATTFYGITSLIALWSPAGHAAPEPSVRGIEWLIDCPQLPSGALDQEVLARTQCGIVTAPLDHHAPERGTIRFDITRVGAKQPLSRQGVIFTQPGGPGADTGGVFAVHLATVWKYYDTEAYRSLTDTYDVIEITPRGLGSVAGSRLECESEERIKPQGDVTEDRSDSNLAAIAHNAQVIARACARHPLTPYITTEQTVRDMDFVRAHLQEKTVNYLGNSYGTWLGAWYGALFPERVGRMVLDSNMDWTSTFQRASLIVAPEKERIFDHLVATPAASKPRVYQLGDTPQAVREVFVQLLPSVRGALRSDNHFYSAPAHLVAARHLSRWLRDAPSISDRALNARAQAYRFSTDAAVNAQARATFPLLLQQVRNPSPVNVFPPGPLRMPAADSVRNAILCNESAYSSEAFWAKKESAYAHRFPVAGAALMARHCTAWPAKPVNPIPLDGLARVTDLLMVQAEYDDQTPARGAHRAFERLPNASWVLLKDTYLHGVSFSGASQCVNAWVGNFLAYGKRAPRSTECRDAGVED